MAVETHAAEGAADAASHGGEAVGMPQLDVLTYPNQIFWLVVTLVVIFLILTRVALPRIGAVLSERQSAIANDIAAAEELKLQAQEAERAYEKALADARAEAQRIVADTRAEIRAELDVAIRKADAEIAARQAEGEAQIAEIRAGALESVTEVAKAAAVDVVSAMGFRAESATVDAAVDSRLKG